MLEKSDGTIKNGQSRALAKLAIQYTAQINVREN